MRHKQLAILICAAAAFGVAGSAGQAASKQALSGLDKYYLKTGAAGDHFEIQGGVMAQSKGTSTIVKNLGARLAKDHSKSLQDTKKLAAKFHLKLPSEPSPTQQWELNEVKTSASFDRAYATLEVQDHQQDIEDTKTEIRDGTNPKVRAAARKELPMLQMHLKLSLQAEKAVG